MAVKIRLKRMGAKKRPFYRVVVADARSPRDGRFIESVGYYDPLPDPAVVKLDDQRIRHWMGTGAKPSDVVRELMERQGLLPASPRPVRAKAAQPVVAAAPTGAVESPASPGAEAVVDAEAPEALGEPAEAPADDASQAAVSEPDGGSPEAAADDSPAFPAEPGEA
ncbi:MAG TPA: 30S ribosomal protein S16 [Candidatus Nanopelagicaceae bacterium]|nr:30S ribosomal protein S16 [Candidatus Nanopelagicaceae bacterium]